MKKSKYSRIIYATPADVKSSQPFLIHRITKHLSSVAEIDAEYVSYQMSHIPMMSFAATGMDPTYSSLKSKSTE